MINQSTCQATEATTRALLKSMTVRYFEGLKSSTFKLCEGELHELIFKNTKSGLKFSKKSTLNTIIWATEKGNMALQHSL